MNMPLVLLNRRRRGTGFNPASLFGLNEPGVWYDPSDVANLTWRRNLLTWTEQFDNAAWVKLGVVPTADQAAGPISGSLADRLLATSSVRAIYQNATIVIGQSYTLSVYIKRNAVTNQGFLLFGDNGTPVSPDFIATDTWQRFQHTFTATVTAGLFGIADNSSSQDYDILVWGAQLELGSTASDYQRITDVNTEVIARFPTATLYQDTIGTIPVTTPGQAVALMLDKSRGLTLGSDRITNGDFASGSTGWTLGANWAVSGGAAVATASSVNINQPMAGIVVGRSYLVEFDVTVSSGSLRAELGGSFGPTITSSGRYRAILASLTGAVSVLYIYGPTAFTGTVDNISVRELQGNHATQATAASRPIYGVVPQGGRRNLLRYTETGFIGASDWTADATTFATGLSGVSGVTSASFSFSRAAVGTNYPRFTGYDALSGVQHTGSAWLSISSGTATVYAAAYYNGTWNRVSAALGLTATPQRFTWAFTPTTNTSFGAFALEVVYIGSGGTIVVSGAQLETGSTATPYQRVTTQYDVTEANVPSCSYLFFDGGSDSMATRSIDFTATDKMTIWAGVRKNSDAGFQSIAELSADTNTIAGSMFVGSGTTVGDASRRTWTYGINGSAVLFGGAAVYAAPITNVITGVYDIAAATRETEVRGRADGSEQTLSYNSAGTAGTGNFSNQPLYLGARGGTASFFNGNLFGLVVRGAASTADQITATEQWLAPKTGVTL